mmetsp:Transcript_102339/g.330128  ORF Transcript_102339/g.330128 Transcript_102339/m.330128 type:complete len:162 (-) Transcript_102339:16-501(-)
MLDLFFLTTLVFDLARPLWMSIADFTYWVLDVLLSFRAGYQKHGKLEMRPKSIARRYVKTWFAPDVVLLGLQVFSFAVDEDPGGSVTALRFARLGKLMRLPKLNGLPRLAAHSLDLVDIDNSHDIVHLGLACDVALAYGMRSASAERMAGWHKSKGLDLSR